MFKYFYLKKFLKTLDLLGAYMVYSNSGREKHADDKQNKRTKRKNRLLFEN